MKDKTIKKLVNSALLASFVCVATMLIQIPNGIGGYFNLGDCIVLLCGWLLGPLYGALSAGIGSMLADVFSSYVVYAPATFLIKGGMAALAYCIAGEKQKKRTVAFSAVAAEAVMAVGYFLYECILYGVGGAMPGILPNILQGVVGVACAILLKIFIDRKGLWKN